MKSKHLARLGWDQFSLDHHSACGIIGIILVKNTTGKNYWPPGQCGAGVVFNQQIEISDKNDRLITWLQRRDKVKWNNVNRLGSFVGEFFKNDLLGGRGWWLVKGALVRGPLFFWMVYYISPHLFTPAFWSTDFVIHIPCAPGGVDQSITASC